jgi:hypothetical protein
MGAYWATQDQTLGALLTDCGGTVFLDDNPEHTPLMSSRDERMGRNEAVSRRINEEIEEAYQGEPPASRIDIVCECGRMTCDAAIDMTMDEYRHVRMDPRQFAVVPEHFIGKHPVDRLRERPSCRGSEA